MPRRWTRIWTFSFHFSIDYVNAVLAKWRLAYDFRALPLERLRQTYLKFLKIEQHATNRIRVHTWEQVEGPEAHLPEKYRWADIFPVVERHLWSYELAYDRIDPGLPVCFMHLVVKWQARKDGRNPYWYLQFKFKHYGFEPEEIVFEVPLDMARLGRHSSTQEDRDKRASGDRQIYKLERNRNYWQRAWECGSVLDTDIGWQWDLNMEPLKEQ